MNELTIEQKAQFLNLKIETNADWSLTLILTDDLDVVRNLTGLTVKMDIKPIHSNVPLLELNTANGRVVITPVDGRIDLKISKNDLANLAIVPCNYDLLLVGATTERVLQGIVTFIKGVTQ